jgi:hypothetical protein
MQVKENFELRIANLKAKIKAAEDRGKMLEVGGAALRPIRQAQDKQAQGLEVGGKESS